MAEIIIGPEKFFGNRLTISDDGMIIVDGMPNGNINDCLYHGVVNLFVYGELTSLSLKDCDNFSVQGVIQQLNFETVKSIHIQGEVQDITLKNGRIECSKVGCNVGTNDVDGSAMDVICIDNIAHVRCSTVYGSIFAEYGDVTFQYLKEPNTLLNITKDYDPKRFESNDAKNAPFKLSRKGINVFVNGFVEELSFKSCNCMSILGSVYEIFGSMATISIDGDIVGYLKGYNVSLRCADVHGNIRVKTVSMRCGLVEKTIEGPNGIVSFYYLGGTVKADFRQQTNGLFSKGVMRCPFVFLFKIFL